MDGVHQVIVAARATNLTSDKRQAVSLLEDTIGKTGAAPMEVSADAGYYSAKAVDGLRTLSVDPYVAPERTRHGRVPSPAPRGRMPSHLPRGLDAAESADQAGPGIPEVPAQGPREREPGMAAHLHRPQPAQAVPLRGTPRRQKGCQSTKDAYFVRSHAYGPDTDAGLRIQLTAITVSAVRSWPKPHPLAIPLTGC